jgi:hypothetical protein
MFRLFSAGITKLQKLYFFCNELFIFAAIIIGVFTDTAFQPKHSIIV